MDNYTPKDVFEYTVLFATQNGLTVRQAIIQAVRLTWRMYNQIKHNEGIGNTKNFIEFVDGFKEYLKFKDNDSTRSHLGIMTREKAKTFHIVSPIDKVRYEIFVDHIYDDFESRLCKNCTYFNRINTFKGWCENISISSNKVESTYGCNEFERIDSDKTNIEKEAL